MTRREAISKHYTSRRGMALGFFLALLATGWQTPAEGAGMSAHRDFDIRRDDPEFRTRNETLREGVAQVSRRRAAETLVARRPDLQVDFGSSFSLPVFIRSSLAPLTPPSPDAKAAAVVEAFLDDHRSVFGFDSAALRSASVVRQATTAHNGAQTIWWQQEISGVELAGSQLRATVSRTGELLSIGSSMLPTSGLVLPAWVPVIDRAEAVRLTATAVGFAVGPVLTPVAPLADLRAVQLITGAGLRGPARTSAVYFAISENELRVAIRVQLESSQGRRGYEAIVDATDGRVLAASSMVWETGEPASYRVWTSDSPMPGSPGPAVPNGWQGPLASRSLETLAQLDATASPDGWITPGQNQTLGNNVDAHGDANADDAPDLPRPQGFPHRVFDFPADLSQSPAIYRNAAIVQAFYVSNVFHDRAYGFGFTEAFGNFQTSNFGRGGFESDALGVQVQDGEHTNNAFFIGTGADGAPARVEMGIFNGPTPDRDSSIDAEILIHELTHGLSIRLHGGLTGVQPRGMGEGWSDFYALAMLSEPGDDVHGVYAVGAYSTAFGGGAFVDNYYFGIRRYPYTTDLNKNPLTYADIDPFTFDVDPAIPRNPYFGSADPSQVHNVGNIWCAALWECRANIIDRIGSPGNEQFLRLVTDGMKLTTTSQPSMVMARDAILLADLIAGGENRCDLWRGFAKRGLGFGAFSFDDSIDFIVESFDLPPALQFALPEGAPQAAAPGETVTFPVVLSANCTEGEEPESPLLWISVGDEPFTSVPLTGPGPAFTATLPSLGCGGIARYYISATVNAETFTAPADAPTSVYTLSTPTVLPPAEIRWPEGGSLQHLGASVSLSGDLLVAGAPKRGLTLTRSGAVVVARRHDGEWAQQAVLTASDERDHDEFGFSVAAGADLILVGALRADGPIAALQDTGAVYVFRPTGIAGAWVQELKLLASDGRTGDEFGRALALSGDALAVGASGDDTGSFGGSGSVYVLRRNGAAWIQEAKLTASNMAAFDGFGTSVAMHNDIVVVGAPYADRDGLSLHGAAYVFERSGSVWTQVAELDPSGADASDEFGSAVAVEDDVVIVGAAKAAGGGAVYVFRRDGDAWVETGTLVAPGLMSNNGYGRSVSLQDGVAAIGAPDHDAPENSSGAVFVFRLDPVLGSWTLIEKLSDAAVGVSGRLGSAVSVDGAGVAAGAPQSAGLGAFFMFDGVGVDCNGNGVSDPCDLLSGHSFDVDGDGVPDECQSAPCPPDLDGDGSVGSADLAILLGSWGTVGGPADLDGAGVGSSDLATLLGSWGVCN